jgi:hypothetical protein
MSKTDELISKMEEVLIPFIEFANERCDKRKAMYADDDCHVVYGYNHRELKIGDFKKLQKIQSEISSLKEQIKKEETLPSNVKEDKLKGIIREVIWQYCYGKGGADALFNYKDIEDAAHDVTELYFQPK